MRGAGASTILNFTSDSGNAWPWATSGQLVVMSTDNPYTGDAAPGVSGIPAGTVKTFTGTNGSANVFTKGATVLNISSTTGLTAGDMLVCWQPNDADVDVPMTNFFFSSKAGSPTAIAWQGSHDTFGAALTQRFIVSSVNSSTSVTVADGILYPTGIWKTSLSPQCGWLVASKILSNVGIENMTIRNDSSSSSDICLICAVATSNFWVKGVVLRPKHLATGTGGAIDFGMEIKDSVHPSVVNNWWDTMSGGGVNTFTSYGVVFPMTSYPRLENNIFNNVESPLEMTASTVGGAYLYNYENYVSGSGFEAGMQAHDLGSGFNLVEGNSFLKYYAEDLHGASTFITLFRNHIQAGGIDLWSYHRNYNVIGNAINSNSHYETLPSDATTYNRFGISTFRLGYSQQYGSAEGYTTGATACLPPASADTGGASPIPSCVAIDAQVKASLFRWGNYDAVNAATRFVSGEVPTSGTQFTNAQPSSQTLPASFIYPLSPSWWPGGVTWPIIGSDVTGGTYVSGHAKKTPAQLCFEAAGGVNGAYSSTVANSFAPDTCYNGAGAGQGGATGSGYEGQMQFIVFFLILFALFLSGARPDVDPQQYEQSERTEFHREPEFRLASRGHVPDTALVQQLRYEVDSQSRLNLKPVAASTHPSKDGTVQK